MSCHAISYRIVSYHIMSCHIISYILYTWVGLIQNFPYWYHHLLSNCDSAKHSEMVELLCLAGQRAKFHVGRMTWTVLHAFVWSPVCDPWRFSRWISERNSECASNFVSTLGKVLRKLSKWFNKASETKAWVVHRCFNGIPGSRPVAHQLTTTNSQGEPQVTQLLKCLHEFKSSSVKIDFGQFATLLRRWKLVMGHARGFWRKNWACTVSQPNLCPGSWQLTRSSSASTSALNFVSSPPTMKLSSLGPSVVMRAGFTVTTLRQSDNPPSWKSPTSPRTKKARQVKSNLKSMIITFFDIKGIVHKEFFPNRPNCEFRVLLRSFAETAWKSAKTSSPTLARTDLAASPWQRPVSNFRLHPTVSGEKQNCSYPPPTVLPWYVTLWLLHTSKNEIEAERTPVRYHWEDPGRIAESAWHSDRKGLSGSVP